MTKLGAALIVLGLFVACKGDGKGKEKQQAADPGKEAPKTPDPGKDALAGFKALIGSTGKTRPAKDNEKCQFNDVDVKSSDSVSSPYKGAAHGTITDTVEGGRTLEHTFDLVFVQDESAGWKCSNSESKMEPNYGSYVCDDVADICGGAWH